LIRASSRSAWISKASSARISASKGDARGWRIAKEKASHKIDVVAALYAAFFLFGTLVITARLAS
jgi:hypothetical protein